MIVGSKISLGTLIDPLCTGKTLFSCSGDTAVDCVPEDAPDDGLLGCEVLAVGNATEEGDWGSSTRCLFLEGSGSEFSSGNDCPPSCEAAGGGEGGILTAAGRSTGWAGLEGTGGLASTSFNIDERSIFEANVRIATGRVKGSVLALSLDYFLFLIGAGYGTWSRRLDEGF